ncbi:MAG: hypothetical protein ACW99L_11410 [Promethearchaeota archaeon]|jgi:DNA primase large subunit
MSDIFDLVKRYPWLPSLKKYYSTIASKDPIDFITDIFTSDNSTDLFERTLEFFQSALANIEDFSVFMDDEINIHFYLLLRILSYILNNKQIANRIAELYSKIVYKRLNKERDFNLHYIYQDLNLNVDYQQEPVIYRKTVIKDQQEFQKTSFKIHFIDYLKLSTKLRDQSRKLVNNSLSNGYVYLQPKNINRLIQEHVRARFQFQNSKNDNELKSFKDKLLENQDFEHLLNKIQGIWKSRKEDFEYTFEIKFNKDKDSKDSFPPCIQEILSKVKEGQNLVHTERLYIVWFLIALEYPEEEIINIFSALPDFNRDKTGYQVRYAIRKGYTPYSCKSLKSYNICMPKKYKDEICLKGYYSRTQEKQIELSRPLSYIKIKQFRTSRKSENINIPQKENE